MECNLKSGRSNYLSVSSFPHTHEMPPLTCNLSLLIQFNCIGMKYLLVPFQVHNVNEISMAFRVQYPA